MIPNLLAQAIVLNRYLARIEVYEEQGNETGVYFEYAKIFRRIFIFDLPDLDEDLDDLPDPGRRVLSSSANAIQWLVDAPVRWATKLLSPLVSVEGDPPHPRVGSAPHKLSFSIADRSESGAK